MAGTRDLVTDDLTDTLEPDPTLLVAVIHDLDPLRVTIPTADGSGRARRAFGTLPDAGVGDEVRVQVDQYGGAVVVAWEPA